MGIVFLNLIYSLSLATDCYRFENSYVEIWYQISVPRLFSLAQSDAAAKDTLLLKYSYHFTIYDQAKNDSSYITGIKGAHLSQIKSRDYFIDYLPTTLYPGTFLYRLEVQSDSATSISDGKIEIPEDITKLKFYHDIQFLIDDATYQKFAKLNEQKRW